MATNFQLQVKLRIQTGRQVKSVRKAGLIPAVLYGRGVASKNLEVEYQPFVQMFKKAGESSLIDLNIGSEAPVKVLVYDTSRDPLTDLFTHVDFYQVNMADKIKTAIPLKFTGEAPAIKELGGVLYKGFEEVEAECLPGDLVSEIEVDISALKTFNDILHLKDLKLPPGIELVLKTNEVLVKVAAPRSDEELAATEQKVEEKLEDIKVVGEEKKKEEEAKAAEEEAAKTGKEEKPKEKK
ncbi:MAG: 50S ribosomal protein L25 [bacterium]|nr:50S ribosomal protein L25 [bacterium]